MDTRKKLQEAKYFLGMLQNTKDRDEFYFVLSAFLSAWRSVLDVMLYDFAENYDIGLTRKDKMFPHDFWIVAYAKKDNRALEFFKWWDKKIRDLSKNHLWNMRPEIVHRGYPEVRQKIYVPNTISSGSITFVSESTDEENIPSGAFPATLAPIYASDLFPVNFSDVIELCKEGFALMESIVDEAEREFNVSLG